jgi:hypothetical protein
MVNSYCVYFIQFLKRYTWLSETNSTAKFKSFPEGQISNIVSVS